MMVDKLFIATLVILSLMTTLNAEDSYCYQAPGECFEGDILILTFSEDVAKYCDFNKQMATLSRNTSSRTFNNQEVVCVKVETPRKKIK